MALTGPGNKVLTALEVRSPSLLEEVIVLALQVELHASLLLEGRGIEVVSHISHKGSPLSRLQLVISSDSESKRTVNGLGECVSVSLFGSHLLSVGLLLTSLLFLESLLKSGKELSLEDL